MFYVFHVETVKKAQSWALKSVKKLFIRIEDLNFGA